MTTTPPHITISRAPHTGVVADGGDALARQLLERAGFVEQTSVFSRWYRLLYDMGTEYENEHATRAAVMLLAAGYSVDLDPSLGAPPTEPALVPAPARTEPDRAARCWS